MQVGKPPVVIDPYSIPKHVTDILFGPQGILLTCQDVLAIKQETNKSPNESRKGEFTGELQS